MIFTAKSIVSQSNGRIISLQNFVNKEIESTKHIFSTISRNWKDKSELKDTPSLFHLSEKFQTEKLAGFQNKLLLNKLREDSISNLTSIKNDFRQSAQEFKKYKLNKISTLESISLNFCFLFSLKSSENQSLREIENKQIDFRPTIDIFSPKIKLIYNEPELLRSMVEQKKANQGVNSRPSQLQDISNQENTDNISSNLKAFPKIIRLEEFFESKQQLFNEIFLHIFFSNEFKMKTFKDSLTGIAILTYALKCFSADDVNQKNKVISNLKLFENKKLISFFNFADLFEILELYSSFISGRGTVDSNIDSLKNFAENIKNAGQKEFFVNVIFNPCAEMKDESKFIFHVIFKFLERELLRIKKETSDFVSFEFCEHLIYIILLFYCNYFISNMYDESNGCLIRNSYNDPTFNKLLEEFFDFSNQVCLSNTLEKDSLNKLSVFLEEISRNYTIGGTVLRFPFSVNFCEGLLIQHLKKNFASLETSIVSGIDQLKHIFAHLSVILDIEETTFFIILLKLAYLQKFKVSYLFAKQNDPKTTKFLNFFCRFFSTSKNNCSVINYSILRLIETETHKFIREYVFQDENANLGLLLTLFSIVHFFKQKIKKIPSLHEEVLSFVELAGLKTFNIRIKKKFIQSEKIETQLVEYINKSEEILETTKLIFGTFISKTSNQFCEFSENILDSSHNKLDPSTVKTRFTIGFLADFKKILGAHKTFSDEMIKSLPIFMSVISELEKTFSERAVN